MGKDFYASLHRICDICNEPLRVVNDETLQEHIQLLDSTIGTLIRNSRTLNAKDRIGYTLVLLAFHSYVKQEVVAKKEISSMLDRAEEMYLEEQEFIIK